MKSSLHVSNVDFSKNAIEEGTGGIAEVVFVLDFRCLVRRRGL